MAATVQLAHCITITVVRQSCLGTLETSRSYRPETSHMLDTACWGQYETIAFDTELNYILKISTGCVSDQAALDEAVATPR